MSARSDILLAADSEIADPVVGVSRIRWDADGTSESHLVDVRVPIDIDDGRARELKVPVLRFPIECFTPLWWDASKKRDESSATRVDAYFGLSTLVAGMEQDPEAGARRTEIRENLQPIDRGTPISYRDVARHFRAAVDTGAIAPQEPDGTAGNADLFVHPLKLFLAAHEMNRMPLWSASEQDEFALVYDKLALATTLKLLFVREWPAPDALRAVPAGDARVVIFQRTLVEAISTVDVLDQPLDPLLLADAPPIRIAARDWQRLLALFATDDGGGQQHVHLPIDLLDEVLSAHLKETHARLAQDARRVAKQDEVWTLVHERDAQGRAPRTDHGIFYPAIDRVFVDHSRGLDLLRVQYRREAPDLPIVEDIDLRPSVWAAEAMEITTELRLATKRYKLAKTRLDALTEADLDTSKHLVAAELLRRATADWHEAHRKRGTLEQSVRRHGWQLQLLDPASADADLVPADKMLRISQKRIEQRAVQIERRATETWTEYHSRHECDRFLFFTITCRTVRFAVHGSRERTWYETQTVSHVVDAPVPIDYDPLQTYLERGLPAGSFGDRRPDGVLGDAAWKKAEAFAKRVGATIGPREQAVGDRGLLKTLFNKHKQLHLFGVGSDGAYRDQNGRSMESILLELERARVDHDTGLHPRNFKLFLVPVVRRTVTGALQTVKYLAVHNPVMGRAMDLAPQLMLLETYRHRLAQVPGHWLGALSHVVSLFPGESRKIKLSVTTEHRKRETESSKSLSRTKNEQRNSLRDQVRSSLGREQTDSSEHYWNVRASGGVDFGFWNAGGSADGGGKYSNSTKTVSERVQDNVREVVAAHSAERELQFETSSEESLTETSASEELVEFRNVNDGRAVNYKFFQVLHAYRSRVDLVRTRLLIEYGDELIPGTGILRSRVVNLDELDKLLPELSERDRVEIRRQVEGKLHERYAEIMRAPTAAEWPARLQELAAGRPLEAASEHTFYVNSGAYFVESEVSSGKATEDYVEKARLVELRKQGALADRTIAEAKAIGDGHLVLPLDAHEFRLAVSNGAKPVAGS